MALAKRMGRPQSETREALLNVAIRIIREDGAAAATSRRIAEEAGVTQQLVYYYFKNMDEVLLATFERQARLALDNAHAALEQARAQPVPDVLADIWRELNSAIDAKFNFEFMTLCNHNATFREEMAAFLTEWRKLQAEAIALEWGRNGIKPGSITPSAAALIIYSIRLVMIREEMMGVDEGHDDARSAIEWLLANMPTGAKP